MPARPRNALLALVAVAWLSPTGCADDPVVAKATGPCSTEPVEAAADAGLHAPLDRLLRSYVDGGVVDYRCLKEHRDLLDGYVATLAATDPAALERADRLAFWINAYNAFTLRLILRRYPDLDSIREFDDPWKEEAWVVGGQTYSLDRIEHEILRARFDEPRIHFAINCASASCPPLASEAYVGARLEAQLERAARTFLSDPKHGARIVDGQLHVSKIFDWFGDDFGDVARFVRPYATDEVRAAIDRAGDDLDIEFLDYDWSLNGR